VRLKIAHKHSSKLKAAYASENGGQRSLCAEPEKFASAKLVFQLRIVVHSASSSSCSSSSFLTGNYMAWRKRTSVISEADTLFSVLNR